MPYGRKSALKRNKPGGGFGQSLMKGGSSNSSTHHQKPDISRLRVNQSEEEGVKLTTFISRDQNVTTLETNDYEDFLQMSLFKKMGGRDLVICNRDGRTFSTRDQAETTNLKKANIVDAREASLTSVALPIRPFAFTDKVNRMIQLALWIDGYQGEDEESGGGEGEDRAVETGDEVETEGEVEGEDSDEEVSSSSSEGGEDSSDLLKAIYSYFSRMPNRMTPLLSKDEIEFVESNVFSEWRRYITELQKNSELEMTPFEKNLSYWRELWRTIERSDLMLEIVDARNPLLFRSQALEQHIMDLGKKFRLCINKADHLSKKQCEIWSDYCVNNLGLEPPLIYSSMKELKQLDPLIHSDQFISINTADRLDHLSSVDDLAKFLDNECARATEHKHTRAIEARKFYEEIKSKISAIPERVLAKSYNRMRKMARQIHACDQIPDEMRPYKTLSAEQYLKLLVGNFESENDADCLRFFVGTIGFPNVGKSSVINSLMRGKARVGVSRTPGKTRHLQTLRIPNTNDALWLCDCPGLVLPIMAGSREDLILNGVISVGTIRGNTTKVIENLLSRVSAQISELYNCSIDHGASATRVLEDLAISRGFYKSGKGGLADIEKMSRQLIQQFLAGRSLSFCELPPSAAVSIEEWLKEENSKWEVRRIFLNKNISSSKSHFR